MIGHGVRLRDLTPVYFDAMTAKAEPTPARSNLSQACGNPIIARFDGGQLSSRRAVAFAPKV
jgi:hypothetical protein